MYKINTEKICTYDLDDILIFYYDFHSILQSDAGVETNLLIMFKVFIIFFPRERFFSFKLMKAAVYFRRISKQSNHIQQNCRCVPVTWRLQCVPITHDIEAPPSSPPAPYHSKMRVYFMTMCMVLSDSAFPSRSLV